MPVLPHSAQRLADWFDKCEPTWCGLQSPSLSSAGHLWEVLQWRVRQHPHHHHQTPNEEMSFGRMIFQTGLKMFWRLIVLFLFPYSLILIWKKICWLSYWIFKLFPFEIKYLKPGGKLSVCNILAASAGSALVSKSSSHPDWRRTPSLA